MLNIKKINCLFLLLFLFSINSIAQEFLDSIATQTCDCVSKVEDGLSEDRYVLEFGLCIIQAATPYQKEIKEELGIEFSQMDGPKGEELGTTIAMRMVSICPEALMKAAGGMEGSDFLEEPVEDSPTYQGTITKIEGEQFATFSVKEETGKVTKFYWITYIEAPDDMLSSFDKLKDQSVTITYFQQEFFDARIKEYRLFNVIEKIDLLEK